MSISRSICLVRHLSTTTTAAATPIATAPPSLLPLPPSTISISRALSKLRAEHDPDKALEIFSSVFDNNSSPVSSRYAQELTIQCLAKARRFADIESLIEPHKKNPKITQETFLCTLIRCYGQAGMFDHAINTFQQMDELGTPRTTLSFNALLAACNNSGLFDKVPQLFDEMPKRYHGLVPDEISFGILIKAYCEMGHLDSGLKTLEEMQEKGVKVTAVTFTTILDELYEKGRYDDAERLWDEMGKKGGCIDVVAYNVRIGHVQGGEPEDIKGLIEEMDALGLRPDAISYNYLLTSYCRKGRMDEAVKLFKELEANGFKLKAATFRTLIHYLCKNGDFGAGYDVFKRSVFHKRIPEFETLKVLVEGLVAKKKRKDAKGLIRTVKKTCPLNALNDWEKVEVELKLVSQESSTDFQQN